MRADQLHQKLTLVQQLKTLARQHEQVLAAYERKVQEKLQEGALAGSSSGKRAGAPLVAEGPEAKRHRQLQERAGRKAELWQEVVKIVEKIRKNAKSEHFRTPVDPIKLKIPDYFNVIKKPMDLGTVLRKLRSKPMGYSFPSEVADDVRQIWINCKTYNGELHPVTLSANACSEAFEKAWGQANIEHRWQVEMKREEREEQAFAERGAGEVGDDNLVNQLRLKRNMLGDLIAAKDVQDNLPPGSLGDLAPDREMTFEEKRKLSAHMASIPGEKLVAVLDIIQEGETLEADGEGEVEVDIDTLHNNTLWKLKAYVDGVLTATTGPPPKKSANRSAPNKQGPPPAAAAAATAAGGSMPPPPPAAPAAAAAQPGLLPQPEQQQPPQQQQPPGAAAAGGMPPPAAVGGPLPATQQQQQVQQPQPMQPPPQQQQQQQQQPHSPQHSGGVSAQEVVGSTAGGPGGARSHQFTYDMGTVAQSGTNRPSNFVKGNVARRATPTAADQAAGGAAGAEDAPGPSGATMDAATEQEWGALAEDPQPPATAAAAADAAAGSGAGAEPAAEADAAAAAAASPAAAGAAAGGAGGSEAAAAGDGGGGDAAAAPATAAAGDGAAAAAGDGDGAAAEGSGAAAAGGGDEDMWEQFAEQAKAEEQQLARRKEEEQRQKDAADEQKRKAEEATRAKEQQKEQEAEERRREIVESLGAPGASAAAANDAAVHADINKLLKGQPGAARGPQGASGTPPPAPGPAAAAAGGDGGPGGPTAMDVDEDSDSDSKPADEGDEDDDDGPVEGGGFD